jgi:hypothetical protein
MIVVHDTTPIHRERFGIGHERLSGSPKTVQMLGSGIARVLCGSNSNSLTVAVANVKLEPKVSG